MESETQLAEVYVESLKEKFKGFNFPSYKLRKWFSRAMLVFFDCIDQDTSACLEHLFKRTDFEAFIIFFVVKEPNGMYKFMDASFRNLGTETMEHFINRYHQQLESMTRISIQTIGLEYIECIGHGYEERARQN